MADDVAGWERDRERFVQAQQDSHTAAGSGTGLDEAGPLAREFERLTRSLLGASTVAEVLIEVLAAARTVIPAATLVSVTLRGPDGRFHTPAASAPFGAELDHLQHQAGRGPCLEAARPDGPAMTVSADLADEPRWPEFATAAARAGYRSLLATELAPDGRATDSGRARPPGALNLYSPGRDAFTPADRDRGLLLATHASLALATTAAVDAAELERSQLRAAIASRDVIGQAKGVLMARRGLSADEAFDVLRRTSQDINVKIADLARTLTENQASLDAPDNS